MTRTRTCTLLALLALVSLAPVAVAQDSQWEITPTVGYRFQSTVSTDYSATIDSIDVPEAVSYGLTVEYKVHPNLNVEFLWSHQGSTLEADFRGSVPEGVDPVIADLTVDTFQIGGLWESGRRGDKVRGYFDLLLGATTINPSGGYDSLTRFSMSLGGGAKFRISDNVGVRLGVRWMPVYINSTETDYIYCDWYWGCYQLYESNYLNQFDTHLGVSFKF